MDILYLLIPLSLVLVFLIAVFFWWSLRSNQYDDLDGPGYRILMDDDRTTNPDPSVVGPEIAAGKGMSVPPKANVKDI
ncbi:MAG: cbb3-type cytochrome oxidase assembly protein CcoS [Rhodocyclales bacterium]|nr:cbb3-type cytochrome oxidase assembly protein CcoS [Rhodocyclales bacterium]